MTRGKRRGQSSSFLPLLFIVGILCIASYFIWDSFYTPKGTAENTTIIEKNGTSSVRLGESKNFIETNDVDQLLEGESIRSKSGETILVFFDDSSLTLDKGAITTISQARKLKRDSSIHIKTLLSEGRVWLHVSPKINPQSYFTLTTQNFSLKSQGGKFSVDQNSVAVIEGSGVIHIGKNYSKDMEVGQKIEFTQQDFEKIKAGGNGPDKTGITVEFQNSDWFTKNASEKISIPKDTPLSETTSSTTEEKVEETENQNMEESSPEKITIITPGKNDDTITTNKKNVPISGTVPSGTQKVIVNDYTLSKFKPGDTTFKYNAAVEWKTLHEGRNEYSVVALKDDKRYEANITVVYDPDYKEEISEELKDTPSEEASSSVQEEIKEEKKNEQTNQTQKENEGSLSFTSIKDGDILTDEIILVSGTAPKNTAKISVNGYTLSQFSEGDTSWNYKMANAFGNRKAGDQTITVKALDADGEIIDTKTIEVHIEEFIEDGINSKYMPNIREDTLPPVKQDDFGGPTI